jgi:hypothetical protein
MGHVVKHSWGQKALTFAKTAAGIAGTAKTMYDVGRTLYSVGRAVAAGSATYGGLAPIVATAALV